MTSHSMPFMASSQLSLTTSHLQGVGTPSRPGTTLNATEGMGNSLTLARSVGNRALNRLGHSKSEPGELPRIVVEPLSPSAGTPPAKHIGDLGGVDSGLLETR